MDTDGFVYIVDRIKDMIITGGENVYSVEVENAIARHSAWHSARHRHSQRVLGEAVHAFVVRKPGTMSPSKSWSRIRASSSRVSSARAASSSSMRCDIGRGKDTQAQAARTLLARPARRELTKAE